MSHVRGQWSVGSGVVRSAAQFEGAHRALKRWWTERGRGAVCSKAKSQWICRHRTSTSGSNSAGLLPTRRMTAHGALTCRYSGGGRMRRIAPHVWTGCPSQVRWCCRKSLICIRPGDRLAGRGLDGSTHAPLISLPAKLPGSRLGHQIQGASINPFHAVSQSRTRLRRRARSAPPRGGCRMV